MSASDPGVNTPAPPRPLDAIEINDYLAYIGEALIQRRDALVAALRNMAAASPTIEDDEVLGDIAENMRMAAALSRTGEDRRKETKEPFLLGGRVVDAWFKRWLEPLSNAMAPVQSAMNDYAARKLAAARAVAAHEAARRLAIAEAAAQEAAAAMRARAPDVAVIAALDQAASAERDVAAAEARAMARPADLTRSYGTYGAVASVRQSWAWRVDDPALVPRHYLMLDDDKIRQAAKQRDASGRPVVVIPGVSFYPVTKMGVR